MLPIVWSAAKADTTRIKVAVRVMYAPKVSTKINLGVQRVFHAPRVRPEK